jgi:hypothetical protein
VPKKADIPEDVFFDDTHVKEGQEASNRAKRQKGKRARAYDRLAEAETPLPPAEEAAKLPATLYLTQPVAYRLEEVRFRLLTEHGVKTNKSAIANYALGVGLEDIEAAAEALREV